jgi:hypothetical protein
MEFPRFQKTVRLSMRGWMALVPAVTITSAVIVTPILTPEKGGSEAEENSKNFANHELDSNGQ